MSSIAAAVTTVATVLTTVMIFEEDVEDDEEDPTDLSFFCFPQVFNRNRRISSHEPRMLQQKPVQVYILLGQSNMLGMGKINGDKEGSLEYAVKVENKYKYLVDESGEWSVSSNVRNVRVMGSGTGEMKIYNNEWMTVKGKTIGPELGIGHWVGGPDPENTDSSNKNDAPPVLILKSCIGNRSLGFDLLPPGSQPYEYEDKSGKKWHYAGYKETPARWEEGTKPEPATWYAGIQYDGDIANAKEVLDNLEAYYPNAQQYEIAGFFWWQGDKDRYDDTYASHYEQNLVHLIHQLRRDFNAPNAKIVCATLGQTSKENAKGNEKQILEAQLAVDGTSDDPKYSMFKGNVATVYSHPLSHGGASNSHYGGNAETYMDVGEAMGLAMVNLLKTDNR